MTPAISTPSEAEARAEARKRVTSRRDFGSHLVVFVVVNSCLVTVWALTGAGYFWPAWWIGFWAMGLILHAWEAFARRPVTEKDIDAELRRHQKP
jgi:hypothetical protein